MKIIELNEAEIALIRAMIAYALPAAWSPEDAATAQELEQKLDAPQDE